MPAQKLLEQILATDSFYCLFLAKGDVKKQRFFTSLDELVDAGTQMNTRGFDTYFGVSSFKGRGKRTAANVDTIGTIVLDLDVGQAEHKYDTKRQALSALKDLTAKLKLPRPLVVDSGRGLHAYWVLDTLASRAEWLPVTKHFKVKLSELGFLHDKNVPADAARVMRLPGTVNSRNGEECKLLVSESEPVSLASFAEAIGFDKDAEDRKRSLFDGMHQSDELFALNRRMQGNKDASFKRILMRTKAGDGCQQLWGIFRNQEDTDENMWRAGLSIAKFCKDRDVAAARMSNRHPDYDVEEMLAKMDGIKGPYTCAVFNENNGGICDNCPHFGKVKSPIVLGLEVTEAEVDEAGNYTNTEAEAVEEDPVEVDEVVEERSLSMHDTPNIEYKIPKYPEPYKRARNGGVYIRQDDGEGTPEDHLVYPNDLYVVKRVDDPENGDTAVLRLHLPHDGVREFTASLIDITSKEELRKVLARQGVAVQDVSRLQQYILHWVTHLQQREKSDMAHTQFGWVDDHLDSFVIGDRVLLPNGGVEFNPPSSRTLDLIPAFQPKGTLDAWQHAMQLWLDDKKLLPHQYTLASSFGSVLMELSNVSCSAMHLYSKESGVGKTAALSAALSVWGKPKSLLLNENDTLNTKMHRGELYHNLPLCIDEITNMAPKQASDMVYQFTGGQQRGRMAQGSNQERYRGKPWSLLALTTGNASIIDRMTLYKQTPAAEAQRVLELPIERIFHGTLDKQTTDLFEAAINNNYGHAGPMFVRFVIDHLDEIKALAEKVRVKVDAAANLTSENRFWSAHITYTLLGAIVASKAGILDFNTKHLFKWATGTLVDANRSRSSEMAVSVDDLMAEFYNENLGRILKIKSTDTPRTFLIEDWMRSGSLMGRYEVDLRRLIVPISALKTWCAERQHNYASIRRKLPADRVSLTKGTGLGGGVVRVVKMVFDSDTDPASVLD